MMVHQPMGGFRRCASDIDIHAREISCVCGNGPECDPGQNITGRSLDQIKDDTDRDFFMDGGGSQGAVYGLIDAVIENAPENGPLALDKPAPVRI